MSLYRKPAPYRSPKSYRGAELVPAAPLGALSAGVTAPWRQAAPHGAAVSVEWSEAARHDAETALDFGAATPVAAAVRLPFAQSTAHDAERALRYADTGAHLFAEARLAWGAAAAHDALYGLEYADTDSHLAECAAAPWGAPHARDVGLHAPWGTLAPRELHVTALFRAIAARGGYIALPWGPAGQRNNDTIAPWPNEPNPGDGDPITVPIRPVYIMIPTVSAVLLPSNAPLAIISARISTDVESWCWSFSAQIPFAELSKVNPADRSEPQQIAITINGYTWTFLVEGFDDNRRFGGRTATIKGRSRSAVLAEPYAPRRSRVQDEARNPAQLGDEALFGTGWTLLWDSVDWLVPGGTFTAQDATVIDELAALATAIGARIETDRETFDLAVRPRYPLSPWEWDAATPFAIIPANIVTQYSGSWQGGTDANGVYVYSGTGQGHHVKIAGTGGEVQAPMIVERLLTHADPARERGRIELAKAGRSKPETITIPLFPSPAAPGLIPLGALLEQQEIGGAWRGQCNGITVDASRSGGALSVRQTLQIERQFR